MAYQKKRNAIVGYPKVGVSYLHGELILTDRAFSAPVFGTTDAAGSAAPRLAAALGNPNRPTAAN